ncbi:cytochrome c [Flavobacterium sp.]|uniref:c-type cytochrome n=1 Tax=Flavobacterium sp. TaxID=239 RepID=UPI002604A3DD|nr:cytochrome c [Flavobacterium sp.]
MKTKILVMAFLGIMIYSCSPKVVPSTEPKKVELSAELAEGKSLYENNCAKCHALYKPKDFNAEQWKPIMLRMQKKAKISDEQREKIYSYVTAN